MRAVTNKTVKLILPIIFMLAFVGLVVFHYLPNVAADNYRAEMKLEAEILEQKLIETSNTAQAPIFQAPDIPPLDSLNDCTEIKDQIADTRQSVEQFGQKAQDLPAFSYPKLSDKYVRATVTKSQTANTSAQILEVLNEYQSMIDYLTVINAARASFEAASNKVNSPGPLLHSSETAQTLDSLKSAARQLENSNPPVELQVSKKDFITLLAQATQSLEELQAGRINNAIELIESSAEQYEIHSQNDLYDTVIASNVLKELSNLPDKANSFSDL